VTDSQNVKTDDAHEGCLYVTGRAGSFVSFLVAQRKKRTLFLYEDDDSADLVREEMAYYGNREVALFPPYQDRVFEEDDDLRRSGFLYRLATDESFIGLFPISSLTHALPPPERVSEDITTLKVGDTVFPENIHDDLDRKGYELTPLVREGGQWAKRGSIIDFFPPTSDRPVRCEFIGDQILSLRHFNPLSQRSEKELPRCDITSISARDESGSSTIIDYLGAPLTLVHPGDSSISEALHTADTDIKKSWARLLGEGGLQR
jgi:transcription-repair coupling factor (superfamily II helicase)